MRTLISVRQDTFGIVEIADDDRKQVVEIVGHASCELPNRFDLLGLREVLAR